MKWHTFKKKLPEIGRSILLSNGEGVLSFIEFSHKARNFLIDEKWRVGEFYEIICFSDDPIENSILDLTCFEYWTYTDNLHRKENYR